MHVSTKNLEEQLNRLRALESRLTFRLSVVGKLLDHQAAGMLKGSGVNLTSYRILNIIHTLGGTSISEISRFCGIDRAQVSRSAVELERRGLIAFTDDPGSKRKKLAVLSADGQALLDQLYPAFLRRNEELDELLGPERRAALIEAINLLTEYVSE